MLQQAIGSIQLDLLRDLNGFTSSSLQRDAMVNPQNIENGQRGRCDAHGTRFGGKCLRVGNLFV
jgi:hypothetical protein